MSIYKRNCNYCGKYYIGRGAQFCSNKCSQCYRNRVRRIEPVKNFWPRVEIRSFLDCWPWKGYLNREGYGRFEVRDKKVRAHRFAWELVYGTIPNGIYCLHKCDNPSCVNPNHLFLGTQKDNMQDMISKGRANYARGENSGGAKLNAAAVKEIRTLVSNGMTNATVAKLFAIYPNTVSNIVNRVTWAHIF